MKKAKLSIEEVEAIRSEGSTSSGWVEIPEGMMEPPQLPQIREALSKLRSILVGRLEEDQRRLEALRERLDKQRFGGGS